MCYRKVHHKRLEWDVQMRGEIGRILLRRASCLHRNVVNNSQCVLCSRNSSECKRGQRTHEFKRLQAQVTAKANPIV